MNNEQQRVINILAPLAVKYGKMHNVCSSMTIAQAILETGWLQHCIGGYALFGVKGTGLVCTTSEFRNGKWEIIKDSFRVYNSYEESFKGYYAFLECYPRYRKAGVFGQWDYKKACKAIHAAGFATAPDYSDKLIGIIEQYKLYQYDTQSVTPVIPAVTKPVITQPQQQVRTYTIKPGDSWWKIALTQLGNGNRYIELAKFNGMTPQTTIYPKQVIKLPNK